MYILFIAQNLPKLTSNFQKVHLFSKNNIPKLVLLFYTTIYNAKIMLKGEEL